MSLTPLKELMILGLVRAHPAHGYALAEALDHGLGPTVGLTRPTIYAALKRFVDRGWVRGVVAREGNMPPRETFELTAAGQDGYAHLLGQVAQGDPGELHPLVAMLAHCDDLDGPTRQATLLRLRATRAARLAQLEAFPEHPGGAGAALGLLQDHLRLEIQTLDRLLG